MKTYLVYFANGAVLRIHAQTVSTKDQWVMMLNEHNATVGYFSAGQVAAIVEDGTAKITEPQTLANA